MECGFFVSQDTEKPWKYVVRSQPTDWERGVWNTIRVAGEKGKQIRIYLNGKMIAANGHAPGLCDINDGKKHEYDHLVRLGWDTTEPILPHGALDGVIDDLKIWDQCIFPTMMFEEKVLDPSGDGTSARPGDKSTARYAVIGKGHEFKTGKFHVPDKAGYAAGSFVRAAAGYASITAADANCMVRFYCPVPEGMHSESGKNGLWKGE